MKKIIGILTVSFFWMLTGQVVTAQNTVTNPPAKPAREEATTKNERSKEKGGVRSKGEKSGRNKAAKTSRNKAPKTERTKTAPDDTRTKTAPDDTRSKMEPADRTKTAPEARTKTKTGEKNRG